MSRMFYNWLRMKIKMSYLNFTDNIFMMLKSSPFEKEEYDSVRPADLILLSSFVLIFMTPTRIAKATIPKTIIFL